MSHSEYDRELLFAKACTRHSKRERERVEQERARDSSECDMNKRDGSCVSGVLYDALVRCVQCDALFSSYRSS